MLQKKYLYIFFATTFEVPLFTIVAICLCFNFLCFFKLHFSTYLSSQISQAVCYGIFSYAFSSRLRKILSKDDSIMKSCSHWGNDMLASINVVTSRNFLSSLKDCFAMLYLKVYRQKQLSKYLFSQLLQFFHVSISCASSSHTYKKTHQRYQNLLCALKVKITLIFHTGLSETANKEFYVSIS